MQKVPRLKKRSHRKNVNIMIDREMDELYRLGKDNGHDTPELAREAVHKALKHYEQTGILFQNRKSYRTFYNDTEIQQVGEYSFAGVIAEYDLPAEVLKKHGQLVRSTVPDVFGVMMDQLVVWCREILKI